MSNDPVLRIIRALWAAMRDDDPVGEAAYRAALREHLPPPGDGGTLFGYPVQAEERPKS